MAWCWFLWSRDVMHVVKHKSENDLLLTLGSGTSTARPRDGTGLDGQERQVRTGQDRRLNLIFRVTFDWELSQFLWGFILYSTWLVVTRARPPSVQCACLTSFLSLTHSACVVLTLAGFHSHLLYMFIVHWKLNMQLRLEFEIIVFFYSGDILKYYLRGCIFLSNWWAMAPLLISEPWRSSLTPLLLIEGGGVGNT